MHEQGNISIHTENIFPIIKKALYSDRDIFLRELVSNAVDAISKLKMVAYAGEVPGDLPEPSVSVRIDRDRKQLTVSDNGIGMTGEEVKKYINQVAFSSAEEFIQKYATADADRQIIGHFGLGFYSAFMVASRVEIDTLSHRPGSEAVRWTCDGTTAFTLDSSERTAPGTSVILTLQEDAEEYLNESEIRRILRKYCDFLPVPIDLNGEVVNKQKGLWTQAPNSLSQEDYLAFYRYLYPFQEDPLFWVHLNTDYPFILKGVLYFPKIRADIDPNKGQIKLFCNNVFVSDNCEEVIPRFLLPLRGAIDSTDIPLNVSRSFLQGDPRVRRIQDYIVKKVGDRLTEMYHESREEFLRCWQDISLFVKFGAMNSDKFYQQVKDILIYPTTGEGNAGDRYTTLPEYLERNKEQHPNRVYYTSDPVAQASYVALHQQQGLEVLTFDAFIDSHFIHFLERQYEDVTFSRVDADLDDRLIDKDGGAELIDPKTNKTRSERLKELFQRALGDSTLTLRTEALKTENLETAPPALLLLPENTRRLQEMAALLQKGEFTLPSERVLLINTAHPVIQRVLDLDGSAIATADGSSPSSALAETIVRHVYDLALMAQKTLDADGMKAFLERSNQLLSQLAAKL